VAREGWAVWSNPTRQSAPDAVRLARHFSITLIFLSAPKYRARLTGSSLRFSIEKENLIVRYNKYIRQMRIAITQSFERPRPDFPMESQFSHS
jgi:hypothetical protein